MNSKKIAKTILIATFLFSMPIGQMYAKEAEHRPEVIATDAGKIDFHLLRKIRFPGAFHKIARLNGAHLELQDGSMWSVSKPDTVRGWEKNDRLLITQNQTTFSTYRYALVNVELKLAVPISLTREPTPKDKGIFFVKEVDRSNDILTLNDNKHWVVHSSDRGDFRKISENDRIIIGVNTALVEEKSPYIIIDTHNHTCVRSNLID